MSFKGAPDTLLQGIVTAGSGTDFWDVLENDIGCAGRCQTHGCMRRRRCRCPSRGSSCRRGTLRTRSCWTLTRCPSLPWTARNMRPSTDSPTSTLSRHRCPQSYITGLRLKQGLQHHMEHAELLTATNCSPSGLHCLRGHWIADGCGDTALHRATQSDGDFASDVTHAGLSYPLPY